MGATHKQYRRSTMGVCCSSGKNWTSKAMFSSKYVLVEGGFCGSCLSAMSGARNVLELVILMILSALGGMIAPSRQIKSLSVVQRHKKSNLSR